MRIYEVEFFIVGPFKFRNDIRLQTTKELQIGNVFDSEINIKQSLRSNVITATVLTNHIDRAEKVAALFIGKMLDVLCLKANCKIDIGTVENRINNYKINAILNLEDIRESFEIARSLNLHPVNNKLLRAYSWYRKGLNSENTLDKFLAFWNSISVVSDAYCENNERTRKGIINRIWNCFIQIWGQNEDWPLIANDNNWINEHNEIRNQIAHGGITVDIEYINNVLDKIETLEKLNYKFLIDFSEREGIILQ